MPLAFHSLIALALLLLPSIAAACPSCMAQESGFSWRMKALACLLLFPFLVAYLVIRAIRTAIRQ